MNYRNDSDFRQAFAKLVSTELNKHGKVSIPHLGQFKIKHQPAQVTQDDGMHKLAPPQNFVQFELERAGT